MDERSNIITIDGPGGAGKSSLAKRLAQSLGWVDLDTGAIYRAVALALFNKGVLNPTAELAGQMAQTLNLKFQRTGGTLRLFLDDQELGESLREPAISKLASVVSAFKETRQALLPLQRSLGQKGELVAEGRDMGTVIFPEAKLKFFLEAAVEIRAERRFWELKAQGKGTPLSEVLADLQTRDRSDESRSLAPLVKTPESVVINASHLGLEEVFQFARAKAQEVFGL
ncbi:MAG: (d)CMP kinase [Deltaproteobacteria bacterium]|jgi:cytidylate kinase|nr:(d)CMP kinase [Deltaproteobacteria bacterium]